MALSASTAPTVKQYGRICFNKTEAPDVFELTVRDRYGEHSILIPREHLESLSQTFATLFPESAE